MIIIHLFYVYRRPNFLLCRVLARQIKFEDQGGDGLHNAVENTKKDAGLQLEWCRLKLFPTSELPRGGHEQVHESVQTRSTFPYFPQYGDSAARWCVGW